jgi:glyoxylase-like metal-dependent hydrolase (beta-lactamase superfamily II)
MTVWQIGDVRITAIVEQDIDLDGLIPKAKPEMLQEIGWLRPHYIDESGRMLGVVQCFVIEIGDHLIIVDTCFGDHKDLPNDPERHRKVFGLLDKLKGAGFMPEEVDAVFCTHLHNDHVGLNTILVDRVWVPTFPNARYLFARNEYEFWASEAERPVVNPDTLERPIDKVHAEFHHTQKWVHEQSVLPVMHAGLAELVEPPCEPVPGIRLVPTPGHTIGHVSVEVNSGGMKALVTGDSFHHPCQIARNDWTTVVDHDRERSTATRRQMLEETVGTDTLFLGTHFAEPSGGRIVADGDSYRLQL